ncbi:beta-propeller domain-containing protein [bacterium]|nr:beta-propeller domain-containing protein [bacterium]
MVIKRAGAFIALIALTITSFMQALPVKAQDFSGFSDVPTSYDYSDAVSYLKDLKVVEGYGDGTYKPINTINRAEFTKIVLLSAGYKPEGSNCFPDVTEGWFAPYVCKAKDIGLVAGYPDGTFKPERPINFAEAGKIISIGMNVSLNDSYQDTWFHKYVDALDKDKSIPPSIDTFGQYVNRGEMAEMIWRIKTGQKKDSKTYDDIEKMSDGQTMHRIDSCATLEAKFKDSNSERGYIMGGETLKAMDSAVSTSIGEVTPAESGIEEASTFATNGSSDYSTTNVQVEGVDEADIVKTDGEYIYIVNGMSVRVVKAFPPENMLEIGSIDFDDDMFSPTDMYVDGDKLIVLGHSAYTYYPAYRMDAITMSYPYYGGSVSDVYIFDISDKTNIKKFRSLKFEGSYSQSRKVDDMVYMVLSRPGFVPYETIESANEILPHYRDTNDEIAKPLVSCGDIGYIPAFESANYLIVVGIPINEASGNISKEVVLGSVGNVYSSRENMYIAANDWNLNYQPSSETTDVYKFSLGKDNIEFKGQGKVPGTILNQFSMDEADNHFRIATTKGNAWDGTSLNNVYILDENMAITGQLEGIAPGEVIHSTRFMGNRLYMVTFKKTDPFFVIDMSDSKGPRILGKLKIPGYSDYLQPYDDNHIIGFGKNTVEATEEEKADWDHDFAWYQGIKLAMFDVTDVTTPKQMFTEVIGDRGSDSPLLYDHKALLFDKDKDLFAFPVTVAKISDEVKSDPTASDSEYGDIVFQGAYVYGVDLAKGFNLKAKITHYDDNEVAEKSGYYWYGNKDIDRILYIGKFLYTVSNGMIMANDMANDFAEVNKEELKDMGSIDYPYPLEPIGL